MVFMLTTVHLWSWTWWSLLHNGQHSSTGATPLCLPKSWCLVKFSTFGIEHFHCRLNAQWSTGFNKNHSELFEQGLVQLYVHLREQYLIVMEPWWVCCSVYDVLPQDFHVCKRAAGFSKYAFIRLSAVWIDKATNL